MRRFLLIWLYLLTVPIASAQIIAPSSDGVQSVDSKDITSTALTVYPDNLGMVSETRTVNVPAGVTDIRFFGVSDMIVPQSAILDEFEGLRLEGNFDSDLITPAKLFKQSEGQVMTIRRLNPVTGQSDLTEATLVSAAPDANGAISAIFKTADGVEGYQCSGLAESLILYNLPEGLHSVPVLSTRVKADTVGPKDITLTYLTRGIGWAADYRMDVVKDEDEVALLAWLTLTNQTSKSFKDADLNVVAGELNQVTDRNAANHRPQWDRVANCILHRFVLIRENWVVVQSTSAPTSALYSAGAGDELIVTATRKVASVRVAKQEDLGDYKLYRAPQPVSVEPHQTKQIAFLSKDNVEITTTNKYRWKLSELRGSDAEDFPIKSRVIYELDNSKDGNLAVPLPEGTVRVMSQSEDGQHIFIGEDKISNKPIGVPVDLEVADSFLVTAQFREIEEHNDKVEISVEVNNATESTITAEFDFFSFKSVKIQRNNKRISLAKGDNLYAFKVPAETTAEFTIKAKLD